MLLHGHLRLMLYAWVGCKHAACNPPNLCCRHGFRRAFCTVAPSFGLYGVKHFKRESRSFIKPRKSNFKKKEGLFGISLWVCCLWDPHRTVTWWSMFDCGGTGGMHCQRAQDPPHSRCLSPPGVRVHGAAQRLHDPHAARPQLRHHQVSLQQAIPHLSQDPEGGVPAGYVTPLWLCSPQISHGREQQLAQRSPCAGNGDTGGRSHSAFGVRSSNFKLRNTFSFYIIPGSSNSRNLKWHVFGLCSSAPSLIIPGLSALAFVRCQGEGAGRAPAEPPEVGTGQGLGMRSALLTAEQRQTFRI